jgi:Rha family phage regulatory protein
LGKKENKGGLESIDFGVVDKKGIPVVSSRHVASVFGKDHKHVLRDIRNIQKDLESFAVQFWTTNFIQNSFKLRGREYPEYLLTRDGFSYLAMGFTGKEAAKFKVEYIKRFNEMEEKILSLQTAKMEFPQLTKAIQEAHEDPQFYHFSNEFDMINRIVLGMTAKKFRELHDIKKGASIRPYLTPHQISMVEKLQRFNIGLITMEPDFQKRKQMLQEYYNRINPAKSITAQT